MGDSSLIRDFLAFDFTEPIRDPLWKHIYLSPGLTKIVASGQFQKLSGVRQLGPTYMVYPGATHTRLSHSLGVFELAKNMITALTVGNEADDLTETGLRSFLCAALLHDLGHFPYAHSLKELPLATHEALTARIILNTHLADAIRLSAGADPDMTAKIIDTGLDGGGNRELGIYRKILSGVLDPDKLDYLTRDAYFCGVPYGVQDVDFIINKIHFHPTEGLVVDDQGIHAVENILFSKYLMYRSVYWHRTVRIATAMIRKAMYSGIEKGSIIPDELYGLDDNEFVIKFGNGRFEDSDLITRVNTRQLYKSVWEEPFDNNSRTHVRLLDLAERTATERSIAKRLGVRDSAVIIDIPEPISFEVRLSIKSKDGLIPFVDAGTVFTEPVISDFAQSLRTLRIFLHPDTAGNGKATQDAGRWLH